MFMRLAYRPDLPATLPFAEQLRSRVMGPAGGTTPAELIAAAKTVGQTGPGSAGIALAGIAGATNIWNALKPGTVGLINGSMGAFPAGHTLRRFDPSFAGGHSVMVARVDALDHVWWDNPEAPSGTYQGEWVAKADLLKFISAFGSVSFVHALKPVPVPAPVPAPVPVPQPVPAPIPTPAPVPVDPHIAELASRDATISALTAKIAAATEALK
jgi:hypothetical protein